MIERKICEGTTCLKAALSSGVTRLQVMVASARSVSWESNEAVTLLYLVPRPSTQTYRVKTQDSKHYDSRHWPVSLVTQQIALCFLYGFSGLWAFCQAVLLLTYVVATKIGSYPELDPWNVIHMLGCITPNFKPICVMIIARLLIFQALILMGVSIGHCLTSVQIRHMIRLFEFYCECTAIWGIL